MYNTLRSVDVTLEVLALMKHFTTPEVLNSTLRFFVSSLHPAISVRSVQKCLVMASISGKALTSSITQALILIITPIISSKSLTQSTPEH